MLHLHAVPIQALVPGTACGERVNERGGDQESIAQTETKSAVGTACWGRGSMQTSASASYLICYLLLHYCLGQRAARSATSGSRPGALLLCIDRCHRSFIILGAASRQPGRLVAVAFNKILACGCHQATPDAHWRRNPSGTAGRLLRRAGFPETSGWRTRPIAPATRIRTNPIRARSASE
jgi:hypothetical protein